MRATIGALHLAALMLAAIVTVTATSVHATPPGKPAAPASAAGAAATDGFAAGRGMQKPLPWPAPVGHRQPRAADVATAPPKSEADLRLERLHRALAETTPICRGC
jgi:hypothetical protein